jgi:hypothetical protein
MMCISVHRLFSPRPPDMRGLEGTKERRVAGGKGARGNQARVNVG